MNNSCEFNFEKDLIRKTNVIYDLSRFITPPQQNTRIILN